LPAIPSNAIQDQFAFQPTGCTTCTLVNLFHHVRQMLETSNYVRCLSIYFSKAFDIVNHSLLLEKSLMSNCDVELPVNVYRPHWSVFVSLLVDSRNMLLMVYVQHSAM